MDPPSSFKNLVTEEPQASAAASQMCSGRKDQVSFQPLFIDSAHCLGLPVTLPLNQFLSKHSFQIGNNAKKRHRNFICVEEYSVFKVAASFFVCLYILLLC